MDIFPAKFSKLMTPDPHYIPGYTGHCPQLNYHIGMTYGQLTGKLLSSPDVLRSRRLILSTGNLLSKDKGSQNLERMIPIPGYTGFVPNSQKNYFGCSFGEKCRQALSEFDRVQERRFHLALADIPFARNYNTFNLKRPSVPLTAICREPAPYKAPNPWKPLVSPYIMKETSPNKYFMSGYTGYVPKAHSLIGMGYPITTNKALIQFGKDRRDPPSLCLPGDESEALPSIHTIYPSQRGLLPYYTGHVPGYEFKYGKTFGQLTHNALGLDSRDR
ncbi:hypothetical protein UPYG_G00283030 [Umbra pygmaea]|uniref:Ciliary microtubule inner protein 2B n=1 Tax=Umbra pygmaea TaxID=75934 RepID=A0ABD0W3G4_UMBPY